jgi:hypothetical protein
MNRGALWRSIQKSADVSIEHPAHTFGHDGIVHAAQCLVGTALRAKPERTIQEVGLVDRTEYLSHRTLDDLVFQGRHAQRAPSTVGFRNVGPPHRQRSIPTTVNPAAQVAKPCLQVLRVALHRYPINPGRRRPPQTPIRSFKRIDVHMVQQRCEPGLTRPLGRFMHSDQSVGQIAPALRPDLSSHHRVPFLSGPFLRTTRSLRRHHRYYAPIRHPAVHGTQPSVVPRSSFPPVTNRRTLPGFPGSDDICGYMTWSTTPAPRATLTQACRAVLPSAN